MNLNDGEEDSFFNQRCLELAKLLRTEQTEDFLHLYDSLPSEWNGTREYLQLETAKEYIRQLQELDENEFELLYQRAFKNGKNEQHHQTIIMSNLPIQSAVIRNNDNDGEQTITTNNRITSLSLLQQKQHNERITANNLACDEKHDLTSKYSSSIKRNNDEFNTKTRRLQSITNNNTHDIIQNNCRTHTPFDSFFKLDLKPSPIDIKLEDYKKARDPMSATQNSSTNSRPSILQSNDTNESNQQNIIKKHKISTTNKSHEDASFDYFAKNDDDNNRQHSRSSSSSPTTNNKNELSINQILSQSNSYDGRSKLIPNNDIDSHGSSIATKSSSENSGSTRTGSCSDSDDEHHRHQSEKKPIPSTIKSYLSLKDKSLNDDYTPTLVLNKTSDNRTSQHDRILSLPEQNSYELVKLNPNDEHPALPQVPRLKQLANDDPNGSNNPNNDLLSYTTTQRSQQNNLSSSSHQNRNPERHEQYNINHSNSSRKSQNRSAKKRKQLQQQEIIRTELIPGHRGDRDVDELVMFIDGNSSSKQQQQRQNSAPLRPTDTNSNNTTSTSRRKSRKLSKNLQESINNNENKTSQIDDDTQSISFIDDDDQTTTATTTRTHSLNNTYNDQISLPNDDDDDESHSNTTNGDILLPEWHSTSPPINDDIDLLSLSLSSITLNDSNSEITSEPFVTVTHRRRSIKERRQDNNNNNNTNNRISRLPSSSNINDKRRFQNGIIRPTIQNSLSNIKPFVSTTTKEENTNLISPPLLPPPPPSTTSQTSILPSTSISNNLPEQSSPRLSSHSSSSSLSSLLKRQSKAPPPVVFLNKSIDIELNDVSFGFDAESPVTSDKPPTPPPPQLEPSIEKEENSLSNDILTNSKISSSRRSYPQRNSRGPLFYSGSDIRPNHHRNYPSQTQYIDPLVLLQYNQQRYQQLAYMNLLRTQYLPSQSPYVLIPTPSTTNQDEKTLNDETIQEPLLVYTTIPGQTGHIYYQSTKKSYPSQYFYPTHSAYFQPISSSLLIDNKSQHDDTDNDEEIEEDNDYEKSTKLFHQTRQQQSSSHIMSNALQLVYSQEKRNAQIDRFNLDQLTAYLARKWIDTIDHYEQGDDGILLTGEQ